MEKRPKKLLEQVQARFCVINCVRLLNIKATLIDPQLIYFAEFDR